MKNYLKDTYSMIDYEGNKYQPEPHKPERKQTTKGDDTVKWLEDHCGFRPFGYEW